MKKLLVASNNAKKLAELKSLLKDLPFEITSLKEERIEHEVEETGSTFEENAILKAKEYAKIANLLTLADDSGIEVDALNGRPGVYSARYSGIGASDEQNNEKLLLELEGVPLENRTARYRVVFALSTPEGDVKTVDGKMEGIITTSPKGEDGFGYDPIFYVPQFGLTAAEITQEQKNSVSHRGEALKKLKMILQAF